MANRISIKDVSISLETDDSTYNDIKGRITSAESLTFTISSEDESAYQSGDYWPDEIIDGKISINGTLEKAWMNNDFLKLLFPEDGVKPSFTLKGSVINSKSPNREMELYKVKFNSIDVNGFNLDSYAKQSLSFNATGYKFLD